MADSSESRPGIDADTLLATASRARHDRQLRLFRRSLAVSASVTIVWLVIVTATGLWERVLDHWVAAVTMVFGSVVAGATPQGGGAVAFPVFTKGLDVPAEAARSFSLCIQTVGMGTAALSIAINRRVVAWRAATIGATVGSAMFAATLLALGDRDAPFWPVGLPGPYVKVTFTLVLIAMAWVVLLGSRIPVREVTDSLPPPNLRVTTALVVASALGGLASSLVGSGSDVLMYLCVVVLLGLRPSVGVATSVVVMAAISVTGFVMLGLIDQQLWVDLDAAGDVSAVGGELLDPPLAANQADIFGMWVAASPIVTWGAPIGAFVASRLSSANLIRVVIGLACAEAVSTAVFLEELRTDPALLVFALVGGAVAVAGLTMLAARRRSLLGLPEIDHATLITRSNAEVDPDYLEDLR